MQKDNKFKLAPELIEYCKQDVHDTALFLNAINKHPLQDAPINSSSVNGKVVTIEVSCGLVELPPVNYTPIMVNPL